MGGLSRLLRDLNVRSSLEVMNELIRISAAEKVMVRWKKDILVMWLMFGLKERVGLKMIRFLNGKVCVCVRVWGMDC